MHGHQQEQQRCGGAQTKQISIYLLWSQREALYTLLGEYNTYIDTFIGNTLI